MLFTIIGYDAEDSAEKRPLYREDHLKNLEELNKQGKLVLAGPFTDVSGSLIVMEASGLEEVESFVQKDPYVIHKVFQKYEIKPFKRVFPKDE